MLNRGRQQEKKRKGTIIKGFGAGGCKKPGPTTRNTKSAYGPHHRQRPPEREGG